MGENNNYHQIGNASLQYDTIVGKVRLAAADPADPVNPSFIIDDSLRFVNNVFVYNFKEGRVITTGCADLENNKYVGKVSTNKRYLTYKDSDHSLYFDKIKEAEANGTSPKQILIKKHDIAANKGSLQGPSTLEQIF